MKLSACIYDKENSNIILYYVGDISEADLENELKNKVPRYMLPRKAFKLDEMPFTGNGKLDRVTLKKMYLGEISK